MNFALDLVGNSRMGGVHKGIMLLSDVATCHTLVGILGTNVDVV